MPFMHYFELSHNIEVSPVSFYAIFILYEGIGNLVLSSLLPMDNIIYFLTRAMQNISIVMIISNVIQTYDH